MSVNYNNNADAYKKIEVNTSSRLKVVVMIYDAAIASLKQAHECHERNDIIKRNRYISRAQYIINELNNTLDLQRGKEIASTLRKLYHFLNRHLNDVLTTNSINKLNESLKILTTLKEAWEEITEKEIKKEGSMTGSENDAAVYHEGKVSSYG